jgi:drug/metabolite transporter (DMT)-like permease
MHEKNRLVALAALALLALLWGYNWVVMKIATQYAPPLEFAALRLLGGSAVLFAVMILLRRSLRPQHPSMYAAIGIFQSGAFVALATWAVISAGAGKVSILSYTMPLWVAMLAPTVLGERLRAQHLVALLIAAAGIVLILGAWQMHGALLADVIAIVAGACWAVGVVLTKRLQMRTRVDVLSLTTWQMFFGGLIVGIAAICVPEHATHWTLIYAGALAYNVLLASAVAYVLWIFVLGHLTARDASMGTLANPVIGIVAAWLQLGETPSLNEGVGMVLVLAALATLALQQKRIPDDE